MQTKITARFVVAVVTAGVAPLLVYGVVSIYSLRTGNRQSVTDGNLNVAGRAAPADRPVHEYQRQGAPGRGL